MKMNDLPQLVSGEDMVSELHFNMPIRRHGVMQRYMDEGPEEAYLIAQKIVHPGIMELKTIETQDGNRVNQSLVEKMFGVQCETSAC